MSLLGWAKNSCECNYYPLTSSFGSAAHAIRRKISGSNQCCFLHYSSISKPLPGASLREEISYSGIK